MKRVYSKRACSVLYNFIRSNHINGMVLLPSNICESIPSTYIKLGMTPLFCDISYADFQIDKESVCSLLNKHDISVLHYNHTFGYMCEEDDTFLKKIRDMFPNICIVDDKCLCFPELEIESTPADIVLFSTGPVKCVDIGWGGYAFISDTWDYQPFHLSYNEDNDLFFAKYVKKCHENHIKFDINVALSDWLDFDIPNDSYYEKIVSLQNDFYNHKKAINYIYKDIPGALPDKYNNWRYQVLVDNQKECYNSLFNAGLFCSCHYKSLGGGYFSDIKTPVNDYLESHVINLFNDFHYTIEQAEKTAEILCNIAIPSSKNN